MNTAVTAAGVLVVTAAATHNLSTYTVGMASDGSAAATWYEHVSTGAVVASVATGGLFLAISAHFQKSLPATERAGRIKNGLTWFTYATMVEIAIGIVFFLSLPKTVLHLFVGGNWLATLLFTGSLAGSFFCIKFGAQERLWPAATAMTLTILLMILVRDLARHAYLAPWFHPADLPVAPQYSPMLLFFLILVAGLGIVASMLRLAWRSAQEVRQ